MNSIKRLQNDYKEYLKNTNYFYSIEPDSNNFNIWNVLLIGPPDTIFDGGIFKCQMIFPNNYPFSPPIFKFITNFNHPNIYPDGSICISILHEGTDQYNYESIMERWSPSQTIDTIIMSILSLLPNPNLESPANIDAKILWEKDWNNYKKYIYKLINKL
jgi:ubiquitin-protein ligase